MENSSGNFPVNILIVDDHPNTATTLARAVAQMSPQVKAHAATSGHNALELVRDYPADILITDMIMPDMNGLELVEKLQNHPGGRPAYTILITAYDIPGLKETARRLKVDEILAKPVRPEHICKSVEKILEEWEQAKQTSQKITPRTAFKILIADDLPDNVTLLTRYVEKEGYESITANDGVETLEKTRTELPDLVLLDVNMPRKDGFAVLEEIRSDSTIQHIPVIILTAARLDPTDIQSGLTLGADDYVTKPFDRRELMARIRTKLRVKETDDSLRRRNRELSLLLEVTGILNGRGKLEKMLDDALKLIVGRLGASAGYFINFNDSTRLSIPHSANGIDPALLREFIKDGCQPEGTCILNNTQADNFWLSQPEDVIQSVLLAAIADRHGELISAILLTNNAPNYFNQEQIPILRAIANQTAVTIENAAWYSSLQKVPQ